MGEFLFLGMKRVGITCDETKRIQVENGRGSRAAPQDSILTNSQINDRRLAGSVQGPRSRFSEDVLTFQERRRVGWLLGTDEKGSR